MLGSKRIQRSLFLLPDDKAQRSWHHVTTAPVEQYYRAPSSQAPVLNTIVQVTFAPYHFRLNYHHAYLIITKRDLPALCLRDQTGQGRTISRMLLSQPPCVAHKLTKWESKEYAGRTSLLSEPIIRCEAGLTLGMVHESVKEMFREHPDVAAIKLTTI